MNGECAQPSTLCDTLPLPLVVSLLPRCIVAVAVRLTRAASSWPPASVAEAYPRVSLSACVHSHPRMTGLPWLKRKLLLSSVHNCMRRAMLNTHLTLVHATATLSTVACCHHIHALFCLCTTPHGVNEALLHGRRPMLLYLTCLYTLCGAAVGLCDAQGHG